MNQLLTLLALVPIAGLIGCLLTPKVKEKTIFIIASTTALVELGLLTTLLSTWLYQGANPITASLGTLYSSDHLTLAFDLYFDKLSAVFLSIAVIITNLVLIFSKYYMHREQGFKRFYYTILMFFIGLTLIILSGNFETLLFGWEVIGITSVLLIAFYRDRFLPARNALKVFSVYRIADAFLIVAIWYAHHIFTSGTSFTELTTLSGATSGQLTILGALLLGAAVIKSGQFPFSYWVPRAMEGPTTSSAIFYGALSVHMGLFLLIRTSPIWEDSLVVQGLIITIGLLTAVIATSIARVQSSIKTQIAYSSIAQIGIMFITVALGLYWLAVLHFVSNALLRAYQLLISPSIVGYLVHDQFFYFKPPVHKINNTLLGKIRATFYVLGIKEWNMNTTVSDYLWRPLKSFGRVLRPLDKISLQALALLIALGITLILLLTDYLKDSAHILSLITAIISMVFYLRAYATKGLAQSCWNLIMLGNLFSLLSLALQSSDAYKYLLMYAIAMVPAYILGLIGINYLKNKGESTKLNGYNGAIFSAKELGHVFFIICLIFMAFPISPAFLAQEILLNDISLAYAHQVALFCVAYVLAGVSVMRLYTKLFFGPHKTSAHEKAYKSS